MYYFSYRNTVWCEPSFGICTKKNKCMRHHCGVWTCEDWRYDLRYKIENYKLLEEVKNKGMNCLCSILPKKCMCEEFLNEKNEAVCDCGVFRKVK